jgi:uncharacterized membrane protein
MDRIAEGNRQINRTSKQKDIIEMATKIKASIIIDKPVDEVFAYITNVKTWPLWESGLLEAEQTSDGPLNVGTTFRGVNQAFGQRMEWTSEVINYVPSKSWGQKIVSNGWSTKESLTFEPFQGKTTKFSLVSELEMGGLLKLFAPFVAHKMQKQIGKNLVRLKDILEAGA